MPERIQLQRTKGWRKPPGAITVARPTKWGNPFTIASCIENGFANDSDTARRFCVAEFRRWLIHGEIGWSHGEPLRAWMLANIETLRGRDLACWCPILDAHGVTVPCHADVLLELANG